MQIIEIHHNLAACAEERHEMTRLENAKKVFTEMTVKAKVGALTLNMCS